MKRTLAVALATIGSLVAFQSAGAQISPPVITPEPSSVAMVAAGLLAVVFVARRNNRLPK